jgi:hypothetical protein
MTALSVTIEGVEWANPTTEQRIIARLDADHYPAGGYVYRAQVITREGIPMARALNGVELSDADISLVVWLIKSGADAEMISLIAKIRATTTGLSD